MHMGRTWIDCNSSLASVDLVDPVSARILRHALLETRTTAQPKPSPGGNDRRGFVEMVSNTEERRLL